MSEFNTATLKCKIGKGYIDPGAGGLPQDAYVATLEGTAEEMILPEGPEYIRPYMFEACKPLKSVQLPSGLLGIGDYAFSSCVNLKTVGVSGSTGSAAAADPEMLQALHASEEASDEDGKSREMSGSSDKYELCLPGVGAYAFYECSKLETVVLPDGLSSIGYYAFCACEALTDITLPAGLVDIVSGAFSSCYALKNIVLPANLLEIGRYAFSNCSSLDNIVFPKKLETLDASVFTWCEALTTVTFNGKPTQIDEKAFTSCSNLAVINVPWAEGEVANAPWSATNATINYNYTGEEE